MASRRECRAAVKHPDVIQSQKAALEQVSTLGIFAVDPPRKIEQQLDEDLFEKFAIRCAMLFLVDLIDTPRSPGMNGRIYIVE